MSTISQQLVEFMIETRDLPAEVVARMQALVLDLIGVTLIGMEEQSSQIMRDVALSDGGNPDSTVFGTGRVAPVGMASLINGTAAHAIEMDDDHRLATTHIGAVVIPAALASAEKAGVDGMTFLRACVMGYEASARIGASMLGKQFIAGFHPTSSCGVFASASAVSVILDLDREAFVNALGIAGTQAFGLGEWQTDGSWIKRFHPGRSSQSGVIAATLAQAGFTGPSTILEGDYGFLQAFSYQHEYDTSIITRDLGVDFPTMLTAFKPYPGCRFTHTALDLAYDFHHIDQLDVSTINEMKVRVYRTDILNYDQRPMSAVKAQFCVPYLVAVMLQNGEVTLDDLTAEAIQNEEILSLSDRIEVYEDEAFSKAYPEKYQCAIDILMTGGETLHRESDIPRGDPEAQEYLNNPALFAEQIETKFRSLLKDSKYANRIDAIIKAVNDLPNISNVHHLTALLGK